jgi:hypothetical protein
VRRALPILLGGLALAACERREQQAAAPPPPAKVAPAGPLAYARKTDIAEISLTLPARVGELPALYARLFGEQKAALDAFAADAAKDLEGLRAAGLPARPYTRQVEYTVAAETPRLISLRVQTFEDTGGAHPNTALSALTWDKQQGKALAPKDLLAQGADSAAADRALCDAVKAEKRRRIGDDSFTTVFPACPTLADAALLLAPSTAAGRAGGLTALFSPYDVGAYVEGAYEIDVPLAAVRTALNPAYATEFAGAPRPRPGG